MKSDETTKSAGYASVLGFNLRQLTRYLAGGLQPKNEEMAKITANIPTIDAELATLTR